ncbi:MAG: hypothetical protein IKI93_17195, partial [Clostridia bacterium]|nr:hypothetical protein [Clostridia bacterium]
MPNLNRLRHQFLQAFKEKLQLGTVGNHVINERRIIVQRIKVSDFSPIYFTGDLVGGTYISCSSERASQAVHV